MRKSFTFDGKRYNVFADTEAELAVKVAMKRRDLEEGKKTISGNTTVSEWLSQWLDAYVRPKVSDRTFANYKSYTGFISERIGSRQLKYLKPMECQKVINALAGKSKSYITKVRQTMFSALECAMDNGMIHENPARNLTMPKCEDGTHRAITDEERQLLLKVCQTHPYGAWVRIMLECGLRPGETALLRGKHVDKKRMRLEVPGTKSKAAHRFVPIANGLMAVLPSVRPNEPLFRSRNGNTLSDDSMRRIWQSVRREMNIAAGCRVYRNQVLPPFAVAPDFTPYCLRHTFCTDLQAAGVPINVAREFMGHSSIELTSRIYTHHSEDAFLFAADALEKFRSKSDTK